MSKRYLLLISAMLACSAYSQPARSRASAPASEAAGDVLALEHKIEDAVVRGDVAFVDSVLAPDFSFVHGDGWTTGGKPLAIDDKAAFLKRVAEKEYLVHDLDEVKAEVHGDIVITYGRYVSLYMPRPQNAIPNATPGRLSSIWFERVYARRPSVNAQWQLLSHRTVHGPTVSPAGVDPTEIRPSQTASYITGLPRVKVKAETYPAQSKEAAEVLELEKAIGAAIVRGDVASFDHATSPDFVMVHGDGWTRGGTPTLVDDKNSFQKRIASHLYAAHDFDSVKVEMHGDVAITYGRYVGNIPSSGEGRAWFAVWYEKIYAKRDGRWIYLSHRTVHGATYGLDRQSVSDK
jgi:ketosteroid isomerase-like protein